MKRILLSSAVGFFAIFLFLILRPCNVCKENCDDVSGKVIDVSEGGVKDIVLTLEGENSIYYINRGLEKNFDKTQLEKELIGRKVRISYSKHWTPLDPYNNSRHIAELEIDNRIIYTEL